MGRGRGGVMRTPRLTKSEVGFSLRRIGKYELVCELGRGAMGVVYKARDPHIGRLVAVKTITSAVSGDKDHLQRFQREAQAAGALHHPNIVTIYEMGTEEGVPYLVMEYLDGEGLDRLIERQAPAPLLEKFSYLVQLCRALQHAHERGVVHRDVKPANIVVKRDGTIRVVDFGIARLVDMTRTQTGQILGTIAYMSPQQLHGQRADERSDIWATGVVAYELLAGRKPFTGENHGAMILDIISRTPEALSSLVPTCPSSLVTIIERAMHKDESQRYQSMRNMLAEIEPVWKDAQQRGVNEMMDTAQALLKQQDYTGVRKQLDQALRIDPESVTAAVLVEELRSAGDGSVLQQEVLELIERARQCLREGLFNDALRAVHEALQLDPQSKAARALRSEAEQMDTAAQLAQGETADGAAVLEREYAVQGPRGVAGSSARRSAPVAQARVITPTERVQAVTKAHPAPEKRLSSKTMVAPAGRPARSRRAYLWAAGFAVVAAIIPTILYLRHVRKIPVVPQEQPAAIASKPELSGAGNVEDRQRALMEQAHEAADQSNYSLARDRLDAAAKLDGPLGPTIEELRRRFTEEEQNASLRAVAKKESDLWVQAQRAMQQNKFDDAGNAFSSILSLPEGGRRKEDAQRFLQTIIPQRRQEESLFAKLKGIPQPRDAAEVQQEVKLLDQIVSLNGPGRSEAEQLRRRLTERLAAANSKAPAAEASAAARPPSTPLTAATSKSKAPADLAPPSAIKTVPEETPDVVAFQKAVEHFEKASQSRDLNALKKDVSSEFERIAQSGGLKAEDARRYLNAQIPMAIRDATPWPAIGCPAAPSGLAMAIKSGDTVACGFLDPPRLKWARFTWPEFSANAGSTARQGTVAMLSLTVDENGNVIDARPRGAPDNSGFFAAAVLAARTWQTTPPRAQGKPVKTEFAVDLPSTP